MTGGVSREFFSRVTKLLTPDPVLGDDGGGSFGSRDEVTGVAAKTIIIEGGEVSPAVIGKEAAGGKGRAAAGAGGQLEEEAAIESLLVPMVNRGRREEWIGGVMGVAVFGEGYATVGGGQSEDEEAEGGVGLEQGGRSTSSLIVDSGAFRRPPPLPLILAKHAKKPRRKLPPTAAMSDGEETPTALRQRRSRKKRKGAPAPTTVDASPAPAAENPTVVPVLKPPPLGSVHLGPSLPPPVAMPPPPVAEPTPPATPPCAAKRNSPPPLVLKHPPPCQGKSSQSPPNRPSTRSSQTLPLAAMRLVLGLPPASVESPPMTVANQFAAKSPPAMAGTAGNPFASVSVTPQAARQRC